VEVYHVGDWPTRIDPGQVHMLGVLRHDQLAQLFRDCAHILFHPAEKENCSNAVLEGLACGLPVLYYAGDGTAELAGGAGVAINDYEDLANAVERMRQEYWRCVATLQQDPHRFSIDKAAARYGDIFRQVLDRDLSLVRS
jgi:glycosyltransferase involved in cell wall biosynthesis